MNTFFANIVAESAPKAKKTTTKKKRGRGKQKAKEAAAEPIPTVEIESKLSAALQERFEYIQTENDEKQAKIDNLILKAAEGAGGKKGKGKGKKKKDDIEAEIASTIAEVSEKTDAVKLTDVYVRKVWTYRKTPTKYKMVQIADPKNEEVSTIPVNDGPLAFVYEDVFSVLVTAKDPADLPSEEPAKGKKKKKKKKEDPNDQTMMLFFYGKWADQMNKLVAKGDQLSITAPSPCIQKNGDKDESEKDEHDLCICIGSETTVDFSFSGEDGDKENTKKAKKARKSKEPEPQTFVLDEDTMVKVTSFPREGVSGASARTVEIGVEAANVGTIAKQQFDEINPFNQKKRAPAVVDKEFAKKAKVATYDSYVKLSEVVKLALNNKKSKAEKRVDFYGVVVSFAPPRQTIRGDWLSPVTLTDDSLEDSKVIMNVFNADPSKLPQYAQIGDVVRCHRVHAQVYEYDVDDGKGKKKKVRQPQVVSNKASSFVVVSRIADDKNIKDTLKSVKKEKGGLKESDWAVSSTSKLTFTFTPEDGTSIRKLWAWGLQSFSEGATIIRNPEEKDATFTISSMTEEIDAPSASYPESVKGDLTCLVTGVIGIPKEEKTAMQPFGFLRVWDGTGAPRSDPLPLDTPAAHHAMSTGDPGVNCMNAIKKVVDSLPKKTPVPPSLCGRVVNVAVWEAAHWEYISKGWMAGPPVRAGDWIRIRNVWDGSMGGDNLPIRMLHMGDRAGMTPLNDTVFEIKELVFAHNKRVAGNDKFNPNSCVYGENATRTSATANRGGKKGKGKKVKTFHCLAEVLGEPAPSEFTVKARIVGTFPMIDLDAKGGDLEKLVIQSIPSKKSKKSEPTYQFALQLEDNTAELSAIISEGAAESVIGVSADKIGGKKKITAAVKKQVLTSLGKKMDDQEFELELQSFMQDGEKFIGVKKGTKVTLVKR